MSKPNSIDLLIIGKTGNGKSATGNSILQRNAFKRNASANSVTEEIKDEYSKYKGRHIMVVDSPGVGETRLQHGHAVKKVTEDLNKAIIMNPDGYHAFIIVLKFSNRFTGEENDTIDFLKKVFGENFVKAFCILVMTGGDNFAKEDDIKCTFKEWCEKQKGAMEKLLIECNHRIVLFDNYAKKQTDKDKQIDELLYLVDNLSARGQRYTNKQFEEAKLTRDRLIKEANDSIIQDETRIEVSLMLQKLEQIQTSNDEDFKTKKLTKLKDSCQKQLQKIKKEDVGKGVLQEMLDSIYSLNRIIDLELKFNEKIKTLKEKSFMSKDDMMKRHQEEIKQMNLEFIQMITEKRPEVWRYIEEEKKRRLEEDKKRKENKKRESGNQSSFEEDKQSSVKLEGSLDKKNRDDMQSQLLQKETEVRGTKLKQTEEEIISMELILKRILDKDRKQYEEKLQKIQKKYEDEESKRKIEEELQRKMEIEERDRLIQEKLLAEEMYKKAVEQSNSNLLTWTAEFVTRPMTAVKGWVASLFNY